MNRYEKAKRLIDFGIFKITEDGNILRKYKFNRHGILHIKMRNIERHDKQGYKRISLRINGKTVNYESHRLIWFYKKGEIDDKLDINHKNGIKDDNRIENLELLTRKENVRHAHEILKTHNQKGEKNNNAKLKNIEVIEIKKKLKNKIKQKIIAEEYNVSVGAIFDISTGKNWKHIV